ncbi:hypothetical protein GCM10029992_18150 [Glycomyces albus]
MKSALEQLSEHAPDEYVASDSPFKFIFPTAHGALGPDIYVVDPDQAENDTPYAPGESLALVGELTSRSTRDNDLTKKLDIYGRSGVPIYLLFDMRERRVTVYSSLPSGVIRRRRPKTSANRSTSPPRSTSSSTPRLSRNGTDIGTGGRYCHRVPPEAENGAAYTAYLEPDRIDFKTLTGHVSFVCLGLALVFNAFGDLPRTPQPFAQGLGVLAVMFFGRNLVKDLRPVLGLRADRSGLTLRRYGPGTEPTSVLWHEMAAVVKVEIGSEQPQAWIAVRLKDRNREPTSAACTACSSRSARKRMPIPTGT